MDHHQDSSTNSTCNRSEWSSDVYKAFEDAPAINFEEVDIWERIHAVEDAPAINFEEVDVWERIHAFVPWRTADSLKRRYEAICAEFYASESVLVPLPKDDELKNSADRATPDIKRNESVEKIGEHGNNKGSSRCDGKKGRGKSWSQEEHRLFIEGMKMYGKGDWRRISTDFVITRTAAQVASHAQKFFKRHKDKKRRIIYDVASMGYQKMLGNPPQRLTDDLRNTQQIGCNSRTNNGGNGVFEVYNFPILESSDNHSIDYPNSGTSSLRRPRSKHEIGGTAARHGVGGASDVSFVAGESTNDRSSFACRCELKLQLQEPVQDNVVSSVSEPYGSGYRSSFACRCELKLQLQEPVHDTVVSSVNEPNGSGLGLPSASSSGSASASVSSSGSSSVPLTDEIGAFSYDFFSADFMDSEELESYF